MIAKMVVSIANADIECNPEIQFLQTILYIGTVLKYEIDNIQITVVCVLALSLPFRHKRVLVEAKCMRLPSSILSNHRELHSCQSREGIRRSILQSALALLANQDRQTHKDFS